MKRILLVLFVFGLSAYAGVIDIALSNASQSGNPGDTLQFFAILTNTSATDTIYLNGAGSASVSADLTIDTTPFFFNAPLSLAPLQSTPLAIEIFDIAIQPSAVSGPYIGNGFSILGGADPAAADDIGDASADVNVNATAVPEPAAFGLVFAGLLAMGLAARRR